MNVLKYQGYTARVDFDERDNIFVGRVLGIRTIISFHADSVTELTANFKMAVDDYLADCAAQGLTPEKPASGNLMLRMSPDLHGAALMAANAAGKSLNQWACEALKDAARSY